MQGRIEQIFFWMKKTPAPKGYEYDRITELPVSLQCTSARPPAPVEIGPLEQSPRKQAVGSVGGLRDCWPDTSPRPVLRSDVFADSAEISRQQPIKPICTMIPVFGTALEPHVKWINKGAGPTRVHNMPQVPGANSCSVPYSTPRWYPNLNAGVSNRVYPPGHFVPGEHQVCLPDYIFGHICCIICRIFRP